MKKQKTPYEKLRKPIPKPGFTFSSKKEEQQWTNMKR